MRRSLAYFLLTAPLLAQFFRSAPQQAPIDALTQSYQSAYSNGRYDEAAASRDQARALLSQIPAEDPQFANWAQRVSQLYESGGFGAQARGVLEQAMARAGGLGESSPARVALLDALSRSWEQDRNLLKSVSYLEQAVAAAEAQPPQAAQTPPSGSPWFAVTGVISAMPIANRVAVYHGTQGASNSALYQRLFNLYRQLGRPQDAAAVLTRISTRVKNSDGLLASLYQQQGQLDEAAAIYKRQAGQAADPQQAADALQRLANLYQSAQRYGNASTAMQQAIGKMEASDEPGADSRSLRMRQSLANIFQQAGQVQAADQVYQQLLDQAVTARVNQQLGVITAYASFLAQTKRADQAETLLKDYQASHASAEPWEQNNLMMAFANVERAAGKPQLAGEYQRRAVANQPQPAAPGGEDRIGDALMQASQAVNAGKLDEAFNLVVRALDSAPGASDRDTAPGMASRVADSLATRKAPAKADEVYRRVLALAESWSPATVAPLLYVQQNYARSLASQQRWGEFEQAVEGYRASLTAARGSGTGWLEDGLRLRAEVAYRPERRQDALLGSQELVALEESLDGATSEPYLRATETLADSMETIGDRAGALPLRRKAIAIADLVYGANDSGRAIVRIKAAMAYARQGQFDEAEQLAREAVTIGQYMQPAQASMFTGQLQQILQMKQAASAPKQ